MRNKTEEEFGKGMSLLFVASFFVEQAKSLLKNSKWFRQENKKLLNLLIDKNQYLIEAEKRVYNLLTDDVQLKESGILDEFDGNTNDIQYLWKTEKKIFSNFMKIYFEANDNQIESLSVDLELIANGNKLYQFEVLESMLRRWNNYTGNVVQYKQEVFDEFLNEYK